MAQYASGDFLRERLNTTMSPTDESMLVAQLSKLAKDEQYPSKTKIESWATIERDIVELTWKMKSS